MKLSRRTNTIILWIISIGLLVGMIITFTPTAGLFGEGRRDASVSALLVNGEPISELEVARAQRQNRLYTAVSEGEAARDLRRLLLDSLVDAEVLRQASARTRVSGAEVRRAVNEFREQNNVAGSRNDQRYRSLIGNFGFNDASFRDYLREQLRQQKYLEELVGEVEVTGEEVRAFYEANQQNYTSEARIEAREIVVEDGALANDIYARLLAGEDFASLAKEYSVERAEQGGALGAADSEPTPVGRAALPTAVADAAFGLAGPGLTEVVNAGNRYYIVKVEAYIPSEVQPFEEVEERVREDALAAKRAGEQQRVLESLRAEATVTVPEESSYTFDNPVVARVGDVEIRAAELDRATYLNPQVQQFLSSENAELITDFFKPTFLESLIEQSLAYQGAEGLGLELIGTEAVVAQSALNYVGKDAEVGEEELSEYYQANLGRFTVPARAVVTQVRFSDQASASGFRETVLGGENLDEAALELAAEAAGGTVQDLGVVTPGDLSSELDSVLFGTDAFEAVPGSVWELSDVLVLSEEGETGAETGGAATGGAEEAATREVYVVLLATRSPERVRPLEEVRAQVEEAVLAGKRQELREAWLEGLREEIPVENLLAQTSEETGGAGGATGGGQDLGTTGGAGTAGETPTFGTGGTATGGGGTGGEGR